MPAPSPSDVLDSPPPLNAAAQTWPFVVDTFEAAALLRGYFGAPKVAGAATLDAAPLRDPRQHER